METKKFMLLDVDYVTKNRKLIVRLFGKLPDGRSIIALDRKFKLYIYVLPNDVNECMGELTDLGIFNLEKIHKKDNGTEKLFFKITINHPRDLPHLKEKINNLQSVEDIREYDFPLGTKYLINKGIFPMSEVEAQGKVLKRFSPKTCIFEIQGELHHVKSDPPEFNVLSFKIETCNPKDLPNVNQDPITIISFSSNHGFQKIFSTKESTYSFVETVPTEKELLEKFVEVVKSKNPDIITGYNSDKFDFPYLKQRAAKLGVNLNLGVDGSQIKFIIGRRKAASIKGMAHVDLYKVVRRNLQLNDHTLEHVYFELFGEEKIDIPSEEIYKCWNAKDKRLERLFKYSIEDAKAISRIGSTMLPLNVELARLVGQPLFEIVRRGTGTQVKWYLMRKAYGYGHILPNEFGIFERNVVGGYVEEPVPGLHEDIVYFDFRSLYPSIIVAKNISPDTFTENDDEESCHIDPEFGYKFKKEPMGFIPTVTKQILEDRILIKSMMKETTDPEEKQILNFRQEALKTLISTIYGLFNHPTYRWYSIEASEAITAWGREYLKKTMEKAEKDGFKVLYADTDGFYATYRM